MWEGELMADTTTNNPWKAGQREPGGDYFARLSCSNCGYNKTEAIPYGIPVSTYVQVNPCPNCGCKKLGQDSFFGT